MQKCKVCIPGMASPQEGPHLEPQLARRDCMIAGRSATRSHCRCREMAVQRSATTCGRNVICLQATVYQTHVPAVHNASSTMLKYFAHNTSCPTQHWASTKHRANQHAHKLQDCLHNGAEAQANHCAHARRTLGENSCTATTIALYACATRWCWIWRNSL